MSVVTALPDAGRITAREHRAPAKRRILETVLELFLQDGIRNVGVDRIIATASVTKATFYKHYRSKDNLVLAYLDACHQACRARLEAHDGDLRAYVRATAAEVREPGFRGCPFLGAAAEFPDAGHAVRRRVAVHRDWLAAQLEERLREIGHPEPGHAADDLMLALDGALAGAPAGDAIAAAAALERAADRVLAESRRGLTPTRGRARPPALG